MNINSVIMSSRLLKYRNGDTDFFYSQEAKKDYELDDKTSLDNFIDDILDNFLETNPKYGKLIDLHSKNYHLNGKAILSAHGFSRDDSWFYLNGGDHLVQDWIDKMDGKYAALILHCCNPDSHQISSQGSAVLAYNYIYSSIRQELGDGKVELYIPKIGYIDSYIVDWQISQLKKKK